MKLWKSRKISFSKYYFVILLCLTFCIGCNNSMNEIFIEHHKMYPEMITKDYYKLLFQAEFGVKHLLKDTTKSKMYLISELNSVTSKDEPLYEYISRDKNIVRINLAAFKYRGLETEILFEVMKTTALLVNGSEAEFLKYWNELKILVKEKKIILDWNEISEYEKQFQTPLKEEHHSEIYIKKYDPHYRVVLKNIFEDYFNITDKK